MIEALLVACCLGIPVALGVAATFRKGNKEQEAAISSKDTKERRRE